jgi:hypothetical protein
MIIRAVPTSVFCSGPPILERGVNLIFRYIHPSSSKRCDQPSSSLASHGCRVRKIGTAPHFCINSTGLAPIHNVALVFLTISIYSIQLVAFGSQCFASHRDPKVHPVRHTALLTRASYVRQLSSVMHRLVVRAFSSHTNPWVQFVASPRYQSSVWR